jgi:phage shock protein A
MTEASDSEVERLYGLLLDEFTAARDETARRLRDEGRREDAAAIKALRKPSNPAWVVNKLAREVPKIIDTLLDAGQRLRDTQLSGGGSLQDAMERERTALDRAMRNAEEIATHAGLASASTLQRVRETLHLAALDPDVAADVRRGVLAREGRATGFTGLAGFAAPVAPAKHLEAKPARAKAGPAKADPAAERRETAREQRLVKAREKAAAAQLELKDAKRELADADRELAAATRRQQRAQARVERARARLETAQEQVAELKGG